MDEILKRLRQVRGFLDIKQGEFSKRLKMPQNSYSQIETGINPIKDRHIALICLTFGVNEDWLRTGRGPMFSPPPVQPPPPAAPVIIDDRKLEPDEKELLDIYDKLELDTKQEVREYAAEKLELQELRATNSRGEENEQSIG